MNNKAIDIIEECRRVKSPILNLIRCELTNLPDTIFALTWLEELILSDNKLVNVNGLSALEHLKKLYLQNNKLINVSGLSGMLKLEELDLGNNRLVNLDGLSTLVRIKKINLQSNLLDDASGLSELTELEYLNLGNNYFVKLEGLSKLIKLKNIILQNNHFTDVTGLSEMPGLEDVNLYQNNLSNLNSLSVLAKLKRLDLRHNLLEDVSGLAVMHELEDLDLSNNSLSNLRKLPSLHNLRKLNLSANNIKSIYIDLFNNFPSLEEINLRRNDIHGLPSEINNRLDSLSVIKEYISSLKKGIAKNTEVKLIIAGNSTTGKSTLTHFLQKYVYRHIQNSTHGISLSRWNIDNIKPSLQINAWDFGGQEYYHSTHRLFLDDSALYLLLWDFDTNIQEIQQTDIYLADKLYQIPLEHFHYSYWLELIRYYAPHSPIVMVQTKVDMAGVKQVESLYFDEPYNAQLPTYHLSIKNAFEYREDPSKSDWLDFKAFEAKLMEMLQREASKYLLGIKWVEIRDEIRKISNEDPWMFKQEFENLCIKSDPDIEMDGLMAYLSGSASTILYYGQNPELKDIVFLNPQWVTDTIYDILNYDIHKKYKGEFTLQHVESVLKEKGIENMADKFLELMKANQFELIFEKPDSPGTYIAPQYLPDTYSDERVIKRYKPKSPIGFTLFFPRFMPKSIFLRFMVRYGNLSEDIYWKYGILLEKNGVSIFVECLFSERKITITIEDGPLAHSLGYELFQVLWELSDEKPEIEVSIDEVDFVKIGKLQKQLERSSNTEIESEQGNFLPVNNFSYLFIKDVSQTNTNQKQMATKTNPEIFFSYAWGSPTDPREKIVNELYESLKNDKYNVIRDKVDSGYKGLISDFMKRIGKGDIIIVVLSDKYLKSSYCMYELYEAFRNSKLEKQAFVEKIFPIRAEQITLSPKAKGEYRNYWNEKKKEMDEYMRTYSDHTSPSEKEEQTRLKSIVDNLGDIFSILSDINSLTVDLLSKDDFAEIKTAINNRIKSLS